MLKVEAPCENLPELEYILSVILEDILGFSWCLVPKDIDLLKIKSYDKKGELHIPLKLFSFKNSSRVYQKIPDIPLSKWDVREFSKDINLINPILPVIYGDRNPSVYMTRNILRLPIDIFGSAFFMLSRCEELDSNQKDLHNRFPVGDSLADKAGFLNRPIVDEYIEILWTAIKRLWPSLERKKNKKIFRVTCDVDHIYKTNHNNMSIIRTFSADLLKRHSPNLAFKNLKNKLRAKRGLFSNDSYLDNITWIMDQNERFGNNVTFYFLSGGTHPKYDPIYSLKEQIVHNTIKEIYARGHEIGIHPSYKTYMDPQMTLKEVQALLALLKQESIDYDHIGGRQHYLRWKTPYTAQNLENAGLAYDSTLGYPEKPGFRCGTSREFSLFDLLKRRKMGLKERPLIFMETTFMSKSYLGQGINEQTLETMLELKKRALLVGGECTILWHNSSLENQQQKTIYKKIISN